MNTGRKKSALSYIPGYANNAVLKLIIFSAVAYIMLAVTWALSVIVYQSQWTFNTYFIPNIALPPIAAFKSHWWTVFTYGIFHVPNSFMELLSNMVWLYCFGSVVQMLVGPKQIFPLYIYSLLTGGVFYIIAQLMPGALGATTVALIGPRAGLMGMTAAAVTLSPKYRFYLTETFSIPILVVAGVFTALMLLGSGFYLPVVVLLAAGAGMGYLYVRLLRAGFRPAGWMYSFASSVEGLVTPSEHGMGKDKFASGRFANREQRSESVQKKIDDILDKINQKGYNSLSKEEKEFLMRVGKE